ncbi:hypothetical protein ARMGADRAFT_818493 [Armillaria gallica]|uniref:Uncharacterized protein n=1 Tax=Armillaria gallica TaxID=47427 RepID=A0A2H3CCU3_ARMGA|nr:hypothetical protein ARMGADRAFT_818493 [Armillaria gallica]
MRPNSKIVQCNFGLLHRNEDTLAIGVIHHASRAVIFPYVLWCVGVLQATVGLWHSYVESVGERQSSKRDRRLGRVEVNGCWS